jgi:sulfide dehydrogenase cytochrome subunit
VLRTAATGQKQRLVYVMTQNKRRVSGIAILLSLPFTASPALAEDETVNRLLASQCAQCHGTNGYARGDFEDIAGEEAGDLFEDLADMKGEDRPENIMDHQALGYSDQQIMRIARYYASLPEDDPARQADSEREGEAVTERDDEHEHQYEREREEHDEEDEREEHDEDDERDDDD